MARARLVGVELGAHPRRTAGRFVLQASRPFMGRPHLAAVKRGARTFRRRDVVAHRAVVEAVGAALGGLAATTAALVFRSGCAAGFGIVALVAAGEGVTAHGGRSSLAGAQALAGGLARVFRHVVQGRGGPAFGARLGVSTAAHRARGRSGMAGTRPAGLVFRLFKVENASASLCVVVGHERRSFAVGWYVSVGWILLWWDLL